MKTNPLTRRDVLKVATLAVGGAAMGSMLGSCTGKAPAAATSLPPTPAPTAAAPTAAAAQPAAAGAAQAASPALSMKMTGEYVRLVGRDAYFWCWPMVNVYNRRLKYKTITQPALAGPVPMAPINTLAMLTDYIAPEERAVACPNQDVVYGVGALALDLSPVVVQVPDFGSRFWVYQIVDLRTDGFADLGKMYGTTPGFYLLVGPGWNGAVPRGITQVFRSPTNTGYIIPRVFQEDTAEDKQAVQSVLAGIMMYPLAEYDGTPKTKDWSTLPQTGSSASGDGEVRWVDPQTFFTVLPHVLADAPPQPAEAGRYEQLNAVLVAAASDPALQQVLTQVALDSDRELVSPLFEFRNWGLQAPYYWSTVTNGAAFGVDYFTRTAVAKSNIFVNKPNETKYFYQDLDSGGQRLNGSSRYMVTFPAGQTPPVHGFWSLTLYNENHFFAPNEINRYSTGTKNKVLKYGPDGSLTIYVQADAPTGEQAGNWLPAPKDADFSLYVRAYWPATAILDGSWTPPAVVKVT